MNRSGVWISGIGALSGAGADVPATLDSFRRGLRNYSRTLPFETAISNPTFQVTAELPNPSGRHENDRTMRLTMKAVSEALADAGIDRFPPGIRVGICLGTTVACQFNSLPFYAAYRRKENPPLGSGLRFSQLQSRTSGGSRIKSLRPADDGGKRLFVRHRRDRHRRQLDPRRAVRCRHRRWRG